MCVCMCVCVYVCMYVSVCAVSEINNYHFNIYIYIWALFLFYFTWFSGNGVDQFVYHFKCEILQIVDNK